MVLMSATYYICGGAADQLRPLEAQETQPDKFTITKR